MEESQPYALMQPDSDKVSCVTLIWLALANAFVFGGQLRFGGVLLRVGGFNENYLTPVLLVSLKCFDGENNKDTITQIQSNFK